MNANDAYEANDAAEAYAAALPHEGAEAYAAAEPHSPGEPYDTAQACDAHDESLVARNGTASHAAGAMADVLAARVAGHLRCRRTLFDWMDPLRLATVPCANRLKTCSASQAAALAEAYLDELGMRAAPLDAFDAPGAALAALPAQACLTVFRLRALAEYADALRGWIDRPRRDLLVEWIGPRGIRLLFDRGRELTGEGRSLAMLEKRAMRGGPAQHGPTDGGALAWLGFRLFERECGWAHDGPLAIMRLAMPSGMDEASLPMQSSVAGLNASLSIVSKMPGLFPEWSW